MYIKGYNLELFLSFVINKTLNMNKDKSKSKGKALNKKDKEKLRQKHRRELEEAKIEQEKEVARQQLQVLKKTGIVHAYEQFLRSICKNGLPQPNNVYEFAAQFVLKYERKMKQKQSKRDQILQYNSEALKENGARKEKDSLSIEVSPKKQRDNESLRSGRTKA